MSECRQRKAIHAQVRLLYSRLSCIDEEQKLSMHFFFKKTKIKTFQKVSLEEQKQVEHGRNRPHSLSFNRSPSDPHAQLQILQHNLRLNRTSSWSPVLKLGLHRHHDNHLVGSGAKRATSAPPAVPLLFFFSALLSVSSSSSSSSSPYPQSSLAAPPAPSVPGL